MIVLYNYLDTHRAQPSLLCSSDIQLDENGWQLPRVVGLVRGKQWCFGPYFH